MTSIEWLFNNLKSHFEHDGDLLEVVKMSFEQAKEMHKIEIIESFKEGTKMNDVKDELSAGFNATALNLAVMYYYETYTND